MIVRNHNLKLKISRRIHSDSWFQISKQETCNQPLGKVNIKMMLYLFVWLVFFVPFDNFSFTIAGEGLQILTYDRHSWPLSSEEGSLACHTYCDTGEPFIMVIPESPWHLHLLPSVCQWNCLSIFLRLKSVAAGIRTPNLPHASLTLSATAPPPLCDAVRSV